MMARWLEQLPWLALTFKGTPFWAWLALPLALLLSFGIAWGIIRTVTGLVARSLPGSRRQSFQTRSRNLTIPLSWLLAMVVFNPLTALLPLGKDVAQAVSFLRTAGNGFAVGWVLFRLIDAASVRMHDSLYRHGRKGVGAIIPLLRKIAKAAVVILLILFLLQNFGFNVAAIIAGLGIGGVAIALASQKSVENLLGGIMLALDQPVRVGDFCRYGPDKMGTVEDIGLRSTRIRTLDRTMVSIPNADFSALQLENFTPRDRILLQTTVGLRYETTADQLQQVLAGAHDLLFRHPLTAKDTVRVRLVALAPVALSVELFAYLATPDFPVFMAAREEIFLSLIRLVRETGTDFAFPLQAPPPVPRPDVVS